ncbi:MAG: DUF4377 domain-containing protein [Polyangiaceae bacterium]|nr:DUF4377 domain-containing protein [Polyangiaceae bacterium]
MDIRFYGVAVAAAGLLGSAWACSATEPVPVPATAATVPMPASGSSEAEPGDAAPPRPTEADAGNGSREITLWIREHLVDCSGESPRKCMQVRETPDGEWVFFYDIIEGFEFEDSVAVELRVEVTTNPRPMADGPGLQYELLEVVSKRKLP